MRHAKGISMLLALATLAALVSCGSGLGENPTVTMDGFDTTVAVDESTEETRLEPDLSDVRYDWKTLFARMIKIEDKYGVTISEERVGDHSATYVDRRDSGIFR